MPVHPIGCQAQLMTCVVRTWCSLPEWVIIPPTGHARLTSGVGRKAVEIDEMVRFPPQTHRHGGVASTVSLSHIRTIGSL